VSGLVVIVDYGSGNLRSAEKAFSRAAAALPHPPEIAVSADPERVLAADRVVLPGVGAFADCKAGVEAIPGMREALEERVRRQAAPFLGVCVGLQLMAERGLEKGEHAGFGWISGTVALIRPADPILKVPHMGWNTLAVRRPHPLLSGIESGENGLHAYFVHSYHIADPDPADLVATADYGGPITAMIARDNMAGTQFHPEKSQTLGLALIGNFLRWMP
jgi:glutamine amidotransferase